MTPKLASLLLLVGIGVCGCEDKATATFFDIDPPVGSIIMWRNDHWVAEMLPIQCWMNDDACEHAPRLYVPKELQ